MNFIQNDIFNARDECLALGICGKKNLLKTVRNCDQHLAIQRIVHDFVVENAIKHFATRHCFATEAGIHRTNNLKLRIIV